MTPQARLVTSITLPAVAEECAVTLQCAPDRVLWLARTDERLVAHDLDRVVEGDLEPAAFPAPWPRRVGRCTVSPDLSLAVFSGVHAVQAFGTGGMLWEVRHSCWEGSCLALHAAYEDYAADPRHRHPENGSARVSGDGKLVWAHVRGPLPGRGTWGDDEQWLVLDAADGRVLAGMPSDTVAGGSHQLPHPDPARMALNVGEGQDGSTTWLGRYGDGRLEGVLVGREAILIAVAPSGRALVTVDHGARDELSLRRYEDGSVMATIAAGWVSQRADGERARWDLAEIGAVDEHTVIAQISVGGFGVTGLEHWLIDLDAPEARGPIAYPGGGGTPDSPVGFGRGRWLTPAGRGRYDVWALV